MRTWVLLLLLGLAGCAFITRVVAPCVGEATGSLLDQQVREALEGAGWREDLAQLGRRYGAELIGCILRRISEEISSLEVQERQRRIDIYLREHKCR